ncbi:hypothetical protein CL634_00340 [bacterium]|nr:hypothetical protein [bacterium]
MISSDIIKKYNVPSDDQVRLAISKRKEEIMDYWKSAKDLDEEEEDFMNTFYDTLERANFMFTKQFTDILKGDVRADCPEEVTPVDDWHYVQRDQEDYPLTYGPWDSE